MEKPCHSSSATNHSFSSTATTTSSTTISTSSTFNPTVVSRSTTTSSSNCSINSAAAASGHIQTSLKSLNRASYKISKPLLTRNVPTSASPIHSPPPPLPPAAAVGTAGAGAGAAPPQPPVYNIDKNDFRDVVQKLTGSPAHHQIHPEPPSTPAPAAAAPISRLHRIRPPPLAHLATRPPPLVPAAQPPMTVVDLWTRPPLSPLPPLPTVIGAADSPISAYMRSLHNGGLGELAPSPTGVSALPSSPLGPGCVPSPRTAYLMMMTTATPGLVFPTSPGVQLPSPRLGDS